jgi:hypothetical protein
MTIVPLSLPPALVEVSRVEQDAINLMYLWKYLQGEKRVPSCETELPPIARKDERSESNFLFKGNGSLGVCLYDSDITRACAVSAELHESHLVVFGYSQDPFEIINNSQQLEDVCKSFGWSGRDTAVAFMMQHLNLEQ